MLSQTIKRNIHCQNKLASLIFHNIKKYNCSNISSKPCMKISQYFSAVLMYQIFQTINTHLHIPKQTQDFTQIHTLPHITPIYHTNAKNKFVTHCFNRHTPEETNTNPGLLKINKYSQTSFDTHTTRTARRNSGNFHESTHLKRLCSYCCYWWEEEEKEEEKKKKEGMKNK